jgi:hypothetical protein
LRPEQTWVTFSKIFGNVDEDILLRVLRDAFWEAIASVRLWAETPAARTVGRICFTCIISCNQEAILYEQMGM